MLYKAVLLALAASAAAGPFGGSSTSKLVGKSLPKETLDFGFPPEKIDLAARVANKKVIIVGLPGAFTPT